MSNETEAFSPKIVVCGVGYIGQILTRLAVNKGWNIVGAVNRAGDKVGKDLGSLSGIDELGVKVQDCKLADYTAFKADIALIATDDKLSVNFPLYKRFIEAGINVLCNGAESYNPRWSNKEIAEEINHLAIKYGVTFTGSGIWDMTRFWSGILVTGPCVNIESIHMSSATDVARHGDQYLAASGVGMTLKEFEEKIGRQGGDALSLFRIPCITVLEKLGYTVTGHNVRSEPIFWDSPVYCAAVEKEFPVGVSVGTRIIAEVNTREGVMATAKVEQRIFKEGDIESVTWRVKGQPAMEIRVIREDSEISVASSLFNRIPDVIAAKPGIVELHNLGPELPSSSERPPTPLSVSSS